MISCKQIPDLFIDWLIVDFDQIAFEEILIDDNGFFFN